MQVKKAKAAILVQSRQPLIVDEIDLPDTLDVGQVLVKILHTTICGAQINEIEAVKGPDKFLPHLLGHEASGTVIETGPGVATVKPSDIVVLGIGGVGLNVVQFAHLGGAHPIVAVDIVDSKLAMARERGATHCLNPTKVADIADEIRKIVGAKGPDKVIETTGVKSVIEIAYDLTHPDGTCVLVGVPHEKVTIYTLPIHFNKILTGSHGGSALPHIDIPRIIRLAQAGRISFDGIITHEFPLEDINSAL